MRINPATAGEQHQDRKRAIGDVGGDAPIANPASAPDNLLADKGALLSPSKIVPTDSAQDTPHERAAPSFRELAAHLALTIGVDWRRVGTPIHH